MQAKRMLLLVPFLALMGFASPATPSTPSVPAFGSHTWDVAEVFSNADGSIQFIELKETGGGAGETGLPGHTLTSSTRTWTIPGGPLTPPTSSKSYLIATPGFAALPGAPTPDAIIPAGLVPFFSTAGDTITYVPWDAWTFGTVPTDGANSLKRDGLVTGNNPTNYAGVTGHVKVGINVPAMPTATVIFLVVAVLALGSALLARRSLITPAS